MMRGPLNRGPLNIPMKCHGMWLHVMLCNSPCYAIANARLGMLC